MAKKVKQTDTAPGAGQVRVEAAALKKALGAVRWAVNEKSPIPVLKCLALRATQGELEIQANNLEAAAKTTMPAECLFELSGCVDAKLLFQLVDQMTGPIDFDLLDGDTLMVKCAGALYRLATQPWVEFPQFLEAGPGRGAVLLPSAEVRTLLARIEPFTGQEARRALEMVVMAFGPDGVTWVSCDGRRLAREDQALTVPLDLQGQQHLILPQLLSSVLAVADQVVLNFGQNAVIAAGGNLTVAGRNVESQFPDWRAVWPRPENFRHTLTVNREELERALIRSLLVSKDANSPNLITMQWDAGADTIVITANTMGVGQGYETVAIKDSKTKGLQVAFNGRYFLEAVRVIPGEEVLFQLSDERRAAQLSGTGSYAHTIMPVSLKVANSDPVPV